jgi:hypothetical protein
MFPARVHIDQIMAVAAIVVSAISSASQSAAAPRGLAWSAVINFPVCLPWRLFEWCSRAPAWLPWAAALRRDAAVLNSVMHARQNKLVTTHRSARRAIAKEIFVARLFKPKGLFRSRLGDAYLRHDGSERVMRLARLARARAGACFADAPNPDLAGRRARRQGRELGRSGRDGGRDCPIAACRYDQSEGRALRPTARNVQRTVRGPRRSQHRQHPG